jgi:hypothetical protein
MLARFATFLMLLSAKVGSMRNGPFRFSDRGTLGFVSVRCLRHGEPVPNTCCRALIGPDNSLILAPDL